MPRIKKNALPPEIKEKLARQFKGIVFEGSKHGFTVGDKVTTSIHSDILNLIGVVVGFDGGQVLAYFKDSGFRGARGTDICTMHYYEYELVRS